MKRFVNEHSVLRAIVTRKRTRSRVGRLADVPPYVSPETPKGAAELRLCATLPAQWYAGADVPIRVESVFADEVWVDAKPADGGESRRFRFDGRTMLSASSLSAGAWDVAFGAKGRGGRVRFPVKGRLRLNLAKGPDDWNYLDAELAAVTSAEGRHPPPRWTLCLSNRI